MECLCGSSDAFAPPLASVLRKLSGLAAFKLLGAWCFSGQQGFECGDVAGNCLPCILCGLIFQHDVSLVMGVFQNAHEPRQIRGLLGLPSGCDLDFQLHIDCERGALDQIPIGIFGVEVAGIQIDADPWTVDGLHDFEQWIRFGNNAPVVFDAKEHAPGGGVIAADLQAFNAAIDSFFPGTLFWGVSGKDPNVGRSHGSGMVDPLLDMGDLLISPRSGQVGEAIAYSGATDRESTQKGMALEAREQGMIDFGREVIAGQFSPITAQAGTVIQKIKEADALVLGHRLWAFV